MAPKSLKLLCTLALIIASGCSTFPRSATSPEAQAYLSYALDALRARHVNAANVDWTKLQTGASAIASGAQTTADTYPAINFVINQLGEKHTFLEEPALPFTAQAAVMHR